SKRDWSSDVCSSDLQQVARRSPAVPGPPLAAQTDLLTIVHTGRDAGGDGAAIDGQADLGALGGVAEAQAGAGGDVLPLGSGLSAAEASGLAGESAAALPAEHAQDVVEVRVAGRAGTGRAAEG